MPDKTLILSCLEILQTGKIDLVDAYLLAFSKKKGIKGVYSFDTANWGRTKLSILYLRYFVLEMGVFMA